MSTRFIVSGTFSLSLGSETRCEMARTEPAEADSNWFWTVSKQVTLVHYQFTNNDATERRGTAKSCSEVHVERTTTSGHGERAERLRDKQSYLSHTSTLRDTQARRASQRILVASTVDEGSKGHKEQQSAYALLFENPEFALILSLALTRSIDSLSYGLAQQRSSSRKLVLTLWPWHC